MNLVLRAQLIRGLRDSDIREKILQKEDISFDDCLKTALAIEVSKIENKEAYKNSSVNINKISDRQQKFQPRQPFRKSFVSHTKKAPVDLDKLGLRGLCLHCGGRHTSKSCRIKKKLRCKSCSQKYHTEKVCIKSLLNKTRDVHFLDDGYDQSSSDTDEEIGINHVLEVFSNEQFKGSDDRMLVQLLLNNNQHTFECDSGCRVTIMSLSNFKSLNLNTALKHTDVTLRSFTGHIFRPVGVAKVTVSYKKVKQLLDLYIIDLEKDSIAGRDWIRSLNIDLNQIPCSNISTIRTAFSPQREAKLIFSKFSDVFEKKIGTVPNYTVSLQFRNDARPVFLKPRTVPYAIKEQVETEIRKLEAEGIIEKTNSSAWGTPLVVIPKPNGELRLCADYKVTVNSQLLDSRYPIPNQEEIFNKIQDGKIFCSLDIYRAFLHLPLDAPSSEALTISTHMGTYTVKKLFFGVKTAPNIFHQFIDQIIQDLPGTTAFFDDCIVKGRDFEECKQNLEILLNKFRKNNLHLNPDKCHLFKEKISYLGHVISAHGIHKAPDKIEAVIKARPPRNVDELRQFLGLVTYYSKFFPDRATMLSPLNELLRKNHPFTWTSKCQIAFEAAKREVASDRVLVPFSTELPLILATDASPHGLAGVLSHLMPNGDERPIIFISRSLTEAESRYSQLDREATAIYWACKRLYHYLYGRKFVLQVDNKPITSILNPSKALPTVTATRLLRYAQFMAGFNYVIQHKKGVDNKNADYLSRNPLPLTAGDKQSTDASYDFQELLINSISTSAITSKEIAAETSKDKELSALLEDLASGRNSDPEYSLMDGVIFRGDRVVIPRALQPYVLMELHSSHVGMVKMKCLARNYVFWRGIDNDIEATVHSCKPCCDVRADAPKAPLHAWETPRHAWQRTHMDYAGPFLGHYFFIVVDAKTKWPEVFVEKRAPTSTITIRFLQDVISRHGIPDQLVSDNAAIFKSAEFITFCKSLGIRQRFIAPGHPATNGQVERYCSTIKNKLKKMSGEGSLKENLLQLLLRYRTTPSVSGETPAEKLYGRNLRTKLDLLKPKEKVSRFPHSLAIKHFQVGERVQSRNYANPLVLWKYGKIAKKLGNLHYLIQLDDGYIIKRHYNQLRTCQVDPPASENCTSVPESAARAVPRKQVLRLGPTEPASLPATNPPGPARTA
ncbi:unnamed protein product, partial [Nesidiocoris tenuis]